MDPLKLYTPDLADDCGAGSKTCHSHATCHDEEGAGAVEAGRRFCCRCLDGYLGDGRTCLPAAEPRRVSGRVSGNVNSVTFTEQGPDSIDNQNRHENHHEKPLKKL